MGAGVEGGGGGVGVSQQDEPKHHRSVAHAKGGLSGEAPEPERPRVDDGGGQPAEVGELERKLTVAATHVQDAAPRSEQRTAKGVDKEGAEGEGTRVVRHGLALALGLAGRAGSRLCCSLSQVLARALA